MFDRDQVHRTYGFFKVCVEQDDKSSGMKGTSNPAAKGEWKRKLKKPLKVLGVLLVLGMAWKFHVLGPLGTAAGKLGHLGSTVQEAGESVQEKVEELSDAVYVRERLELENAQLRHWIEDEKFNCRTLAAERKTKEISMRLNEKTGALVGRTLASIDYRPPTHLLPNQLLTLAVSYFKAGESEKSAVIMTFLTGQEENDTYKTPKNYLLTGISWYRVDHFNLAQSYFDKILQEKPAKELLGYQAQARLWSALVSKRLGQASKSQEWLTKLLDHHPHSMEAAWVNRSIAGVTHE